MKGFSREQLQSIGFSFVMDNVEPCNCYGEERKKNITWCTNDEKSALFRQIRQLSDFIEIWKTYPHIVEDIKNILCRFKEIRGILRKIENAAEFLDETEFFELKNFAMDMEYLLAEVNKIKLDLDRVIPFSTKEIIKALNPEDQITRTFSIYNQYSPQLTAIRKEKQEIEKQIAGKNENQQTLLFKRNEIVERERVEENRVKKMLTDRMHADLDELKMNTRFIAELDFLVAKSALAIKYNCRKPHFSDLECIEAGDLINPFVVSILQNNGKKFTPINMTLKNGANVLTGANMGGKSVTLATLTLNILLAHCGFYVFAKNFNLPVLDYIFYLSNDYQSITEGLSSFGAEVKEIIKLIDEMKIKKGFCALDEFAKGTNPEEGEMMVRAFLRLAEQYKSFCLLSTHLSGVVMQGMNHFQVVGLKKVNLTRFATEKARQSFGFLQELMDFSIESVGWNSPPPKDAIRVAELMGIQEEFLDLVKDNYKEPKC